ncbi:glycosyltransferase family 2 protein [Telluribacter sp. SYSU D00476]|uniref:glycosyltransferase family 2 protein n=1 Tax=Telluribacter sp. SYSU D00476 TaxID=2811430 RepID=UPI001FF0E462|nr:glycosyltransferase family 2 protein [Telluribacter sp. SYSU D00476]
MTPISVVIITYNEAQALPLTLRSVAWADEIIVVDSGSTDATVALAEGMGARVFHRSFDGYGSQKRYAVGQATHDWILSIDADEVVSPELTLEIQQVLRQGPGCQGYRFPISLVYQGRLLRHSGEYNKRFLRLFDRRTGNYTTDNVHEKVVVTGKVGTLSNRIYHYSFENITDHFLKIDRYTTIAAHAMHQRGKRSSRLKAVFRLPLTFLRIYILRLGILDGYEGFLWALYMSVYTMTKYTKLVELQNKNTVITTQPGYVLETLVAQ